MKKFLIAGAAASALTFAAGAAGAASFPAIGFDSGPGVLITLNSNGTATVSDTGQGPYDNIEDTYVGVINNTDHTVNKLHITSFSDIFGFDGDGIDGYYYLNIPNNAFDTSGYGGPNAYFTNIGFNNTVGNFGDVNFINPIAASGGSDYFSLEEKVTAADFTTPVTTGAPEPAAWAMMLMGFFGLGSMVRARREVTA